MESEGILPPAISRVRANTGKKNRFLKTSFTPTGSADILMEGDMLIPKTRTAMKCIHKQYSCLWPKSYNGKVEIPFTLSEKYGGFKFLTEYIGDWVSSCYCFSFTYWNTFVHNCRQRWEAYDSKCHEGLWTKNLHSLHSSKIRENASKHWAKIWVSYWQFFQWCQSSSQTYPAQQWQRDYIKCYNTKSSTWLVFTQRHVIMPLWFIFSCSCVRLNSSGWKKMKMSLFDILNNAPKSQRTLAEFLILYCEKMLVNTYKGTTVHQITPDAPHLMSQNLLGSTFIK